MIETVFALLLILNGEIIEHTYKELEQEKAEQDTYENNGLVIDDTGECESCQ